MKVILPLSLVSLLLFSCSFDTAGLKEPEPHKECQGDPPLSENQLGVCAGSLKVCDQGEWVEPDYTQLEGYQSPEESCDNLDNDCDGIADAGECGAGGTCDDSGGTPTCACLEGYVPTGEGCADIDECQAAPCDDHATCQNSAGAFTCTCNEGWEGDGLSCTQVDDCLTAACHRDAICTDEHMGYSCTCKPGFVGDGVTCTPTSCHVIAQHYPGTPDGTQLINTGTGGDLPVFCDMTSDKGLGYTMVRFDDPTLSGDQDSYRALCASFGLEIIVPRTRAHARAISSFNGGLPNLINVFPTQDGTTYLEGWQGICQGAPCSFYLSNSRFSCGTSEPSGNGSTPYSLYLWRHDEGTWGCWDDANNHVDEAYRGYVICSTNDTPEPQEESCLDYVAASSVWNKGVNGISGHYEITLDGSRVMAYCDQRVDGGGWTMVLNYLHAAGTTPPLAPLTDTLPLLGSSALGTDESGTANWGHAAPSLLSTMEVTELWFYGRTSGHSRIIHFSTADASCIDYLQSGTGSCSGISTGYHGYATQSANLPGQLDNAYQDRGDEAMTAFPFYTSGNYHWAVKAPGERWEVDDFGRNDNNTLHRVFVRNKPTGTSCLDILNTGRSLGSGYYPIDVDGAGPEPTFLTYCDMTTDGGGWTLVALYGTNTPRPTSWSGNDYPRPGAAFYHSPTTGPTMDRNILNAANNNGDFASFSIDAKALYENSTGQVLLYVGGTTDDYLVATLPGGCNYFDGTTTCLEDIYGPFLIYGSDGALLTGTAYACTTAHGLDPYTADVYDEFGLHVIDGADTAATYNCAYSASSLGHQNMGRLFTSFESSSGSFWNAGIHSHWNETGEFNQPGALFIR